MDIYNLTTQELINELYNRKDCIYLNIITLDDIFERFNDELLDNEELFNTQIDKDCLSDEEVLMIGKELEKHLDYEYDSYPSIYDFPSLIKRAQRDSIINNILK